MGQHARGRACHTSCPRFCARQTPVGQECGEVDGPADGQGGAHLYGDLSQWQADQGPRPSLEAPRKFAPKAAAAPKPPSKRLTYMEQREWEQIESKITVAEAEVQRLHKAMEDPAILADRDRLNDCCHNMGEAQELVRALYARWEELEAKQR